MKCGYREALIVAVSFIIGVVVVVLIVHSKERQDLHVYRFCRDAPIKVSGKNNIDGEDKLNPYVAYCEQESYGGGWMVIQHRFNGSLSFDRNWTEYRNGFGDVEGEHWLGLEKVHQLTKEYDCELLVEMKDFNDDYKYAWYSSFGIGNEAEQYNLTTLETHNGTVRDSLKYHEGMMFSTPDRDNDPSSGNCAKKWHGGWWFNKCARVHLNGLYQNVSGSSAQNIWWEAFGSDNQALSYTRMLIRPN